MCPSKRKVGFEKCVVLTDCPRRALYRLLFKNNRHDSYGACTPLRGRRSREPTESIDIDGGELRISAFRNVIGTARTRPGPIAVGRFRIRRDVFPSIVRNTRTNSARIGERQFI